MLLLMELATTSQHLAATRSRRAKAALVADLLRRAGPADSELVVGFLVGDPRQGRTGIGWSTLQRRGDVPPAARPTLTLADVDQALDALQSATGPGSQQQRSHLLHQLWSRATEPEQDFLARLFLAELRHGALEGIMLDAIAAATGIDVATVRRAAMVTGDLRLVAGLATAGGPEALREVRLDVGRGLLPMLASTATDVADALSRTGPASVEWKLDGVRIQVHKDEHGVRVLSRNLNDLTDRAPAVADAVGRLPAARLVLDGEALGLDDAGRPHPFQDSMSGLGSQPGMTSASALTPFFFDVLHLEGDDLLDCTLAQRQARLDSVLEPAMVVPRITTDDPQAAGEFLERALDAGHEGVLVKSLASTYDAGRRGSQWLKVKPVHTFDLVVLAAEWGHGRRRGWLSNLHLGARDPGSGSFVMVGKTFKGLTDELLGWQTSRLLELEDSRSAGTVHVQPHLVVEVGIDGVQRSSRYPGGLSLRFARVRRYRPDKDPDQADTLDSLRALSPGTAPRTRR